MTDTSTGKPAREKPPVYHDAYMNFGKHKGKTVAFVMEIDPSYILWLRESGYLLDQELLDFAEKQARQDPEKLRSLRMKMGTTSTPKLAKPVAPVREKDLAWGSW